MIVLYIILAIVALVCVVLGMRVSLNIIYEEELIVFLRIFFIKIQLMPEKSKKLKKKKQKKKKEAVAIRNSSEPKPRGLVDNIKLIREIISLLFKDFSHHLHVKLAKIHIRVATPDAAQTALLYGLVGTAVEGLIAVIDKITNLDKIKEHAIYVEPDFLSDKSKVAINIRLSISGLGAIIVLLKTVFNYEKLKNRK